LSNKINATESTNQLIWIALSENSPGLRPMGANLSWMFLVKFPQNSHLQDDDFVGNFKLQKSSTAPSYRRNLRFSELVQQQLGFGSQSMRAVGISIV
jgi:hypothetical protein